MEIINKMKKREEKQWHLGDVAEEKKESRRDAYSKLTSKKLADALNEEYARSQIMGKSAWQNEDFQKLMLEVANRWAEDNKRKRVKLEF